MKENKDKGVEDATQKPELMDESEILNLDGLVPKMESLPEVVEAKPCIISDDKILGLYDEILENARSDRKQADELLLNFLEMVMNDGESSAAAKEAIVNLMKVKTDINDKMAKIADLETRIKLKDKDTFPRYLAQQQNNKVVIENSSKRDLIKMIGKAKNKEKKNDK